MEIVILKNVVKKASLISPVPGGVGPMTIYSLIEQLVKSAEASDYE